MLFQLFERSKTNKNMSNKSLQFVQDLSIQSTLLRFLHVRFFHRTGRWADGSDGGGATATAGGRVAQGAVFGATFVHLTWLISMVGTLASKIPTLGPKVNFLQHQDGSTWLNMAEWLGGLGRKSILTPLNPLKLVELSSLGMRNILNLKFYSIFSGI